MKFTLEIKLGNDAMQTPSDVRKAIAHSLDNDVVFDGDIMAVGDKYLIRDYNGNTVGKWQVTE